MSKRLSDSALVKMTFHNPLYGVNAKTRSLSYKLGIPSEISFQIGHPLTKSLVINTAN